MIRNKLPEQVDRNTYGIFHKRDSYIVLNITGEDEALASKMRKGAHIHTWLGKESTTEKTAVAALRSVELNKLLQDRGVLHREEEGEESVLFSSHFQDGFQVKEGGTENAFRNYKNSPITTSHISRYEVPRLYCVQWESIGNRTSNGVNIIVVEPYFESLSQYESYI